MDVLLNNSSLGLTDIPATNDLFDIEPYIKGLVGFIKECRTPMTISIQGPWGTGKTSIMRMIHHRIDPAGDLEQNIESNPDYKCVYFNTWQFSQFNLSDNISLVMLQQLTNALIQNDKTIGDSFKETLGKAFSVAIQIGAGYLSGGAGVNPKDTFKKEDLDELKELKNEFQILINKKLGLTDKSFKLQKKPEADKEELNRTDPNKRVIFFVDDLDRLNPEKAVEILEVLKNFLDCKNCVFVLAIDYDVVCRGVAGKYKFDINDPANNKKGKEFFDKIIQVPFKMPVEQYNITSYMKELLSSIRVGGETLMGPSEDYSSYEDLVISSIGTNPRAIKRLINSFQLISMVVNYNNEIDLKKSKLLLFATLCLQELDINLYQAIARKKDELQPENLTCFINDSDEDTISQQFDGLDTEKLDLKRIEGFMGRLVDILDTDKTNPLDEVELDAFKKILKIAAITGNDTPTREVKKGNAEVRGSVSELLNVRNIEACNHIFELISNETQAAGVTPIVKDRPKDIAIVVKYPRADKLKIEFYETTKGDGYTIWLEARESFFANLPESIKKLKEEREAKRGKPIAVNHTSKDSKNMYFSYKIENNEDDEKHVRELLRACNEA